MEDIMPNPGKTRALPPGLVVLAVTYFALGTGSLAVVGLLGPMAASLDVTQPEIAQLVTVFALTFAVAAPGLQVLLGHWPRRSVLLLGLALQALGCLAAAIAPTFAWAIVARIVLALGSAAVGPMASALAAHIVPPQQQMRALSFVFAGLIVATVLGVPLATWTGQVLGWRGVFVALGLVSLASIPATLRWIHDRSENMPLRINTLGTVLRDRATALSVLVTLLQTAGQFASYTLVAPLLMDRFGVPVAVVPLALLAFGIGGLAGNLLGARLGDSHSPARLVATAILGLTALFLAMSVVPALPAFAFVLMVVWALLAMLFQAPQQKLLLGLAPGLAGLVLALNSSAIYLGISLGTLSGSVALHQSGIAALPLVSMVWLLLATAVLWLSRRPSHGVPA